MGYVLMSLKQSQLFIFLLHNFSASSIHFKMTHTLPCERYSKNVWVGLPRFSDVGFLELISRLETGVLETNIC